MLNPQNLKNGQEQYEKFTYRVGGKNKTRYQYDYRDGDGKLFSCTKPTLKECRAARDIAVKLEIKRWYDELPSRTTQEIMDELKLPQEVE